MSREKTHGPRSSGVSAARVLWELRWWSGHGDVWRAWVAECDRIHGLGVGTQLSRDRPQPGVDVRGGDAQ